MGLAKEVIIALCVAGLVKVAIDAALAFRRGFAALGYVSTFDDIVASFSQREQRPC